jgi:PadR family transcriptional regulator, regulatory protein PadR
MGTETISDNGKAQMRKGILEFCILLIISKGQIYASDILAELLAADLLVVEGTLYPLLSRLKSAGLLDYTWIESKNGPPRKYYTLTLKGRAALAEQQISWTSLSLSITALITKYEKNN